MKKTTHGVVYKTQNVDYQLHGHPNKYWRRFVKQVSQRHLYRKKKKNENPGQATLLITAWPAARSHKQRYLSSYLIGRQL